jgi:sensor histidine kinase YesM
MKWPREKYIRWIGIPLLGFVISFITNDKSHQKLGMISNVTISIIFTAILWNGVYFIIMFYRRKYSSVEFTAKRLVISAILSALFLIVGANVIRLVMGLVTLKELTSLREILHYAHVNIVAGILVSSIYEGTYFFGKWKESVQLNEELKNQQIRTQFEVLQNQMSPHFLFNSLNTLTTLIAENPEIAIDFTQTLSEVYRYILQNKEKQLVTLSEELAFSESYLYLQKMRYPDNLNFSCTIDSTQKDLSIPPLTLQMLIENAIKHNVVSKKCLFI